MLTGLTNKYNIWASTLDKQDVEVMKDRIKNGANLLEDHVFQFDFLNDDFETLPTPLRAIINDSEKRKKLVIYINPPYAEATTSKTITRTGTNKIGVATNHIAKDFFRSRIGNASNELFALFIAQVYDKIPDCTLGIFSKMKIHGSNFVKFKEYFQAKFLNGFIVHAATFDNVKGNFPIGFTIWDLNQKEKIKHIICEAYNKNSELISTKIFIGDLPQSINKWIKKYDQKNDVIGLMVSCAPDFQHNKQLAILSKQQERYCFNITPNNLIVFSIYFAVRNSIEHNWLNDRDQFLYPNDGWKNDKEFQNDCLAFTLFNNNIQSRQSTNHWIPFTEYEVEAKEKFESNFMSNFINGKAYKNVNSQTTMHNINETNLLFSDEAALVFKAGKNLWQYYHKQSHSNVNASLYEIREYFQGKNQNGTMNTKSNDAIYNALIKELRDKLKVLAKKIDPKVYEYGFLK